MTPLVPPNVTWRLLIYGISNYAQVGMWNDIW